MTVIYSDRNFAVKVESGFAGLPHISIYKEEAPQLYEPGYEVRPVNADVIKNLTRAAELGVYDGEIPQAEWPEEEYTREDLLEWVKSAADKRWFDDESGHYVYPDFDGKPMRESREFVIDRKVVKITLRPGSSHFEWGSSDDAVDDIRQAIRAENPWLAEYCDRATAVYHDLFQRMRAEQEADGLAKERARLIQYVESLKVA